MLTVIECRAQNKVAFYFSAHEDDWQLFMNPNAYYDVQDDSGKIIFIYVTAGDNGAGPGNAGRSQPYYLARENGARVSVKFMADVRRPPTSQDESVVMVSGHPVIRWAYGNTVSYFMRLPDGGVNGTGYVNTGWQSLKKLHEGAIPTMTAIDGSAIYNGWSDLVGMLRGLVDQERGQSNHIWINIADTCLEKNVGDHPDHQHLAQGVLEAVSNFTHINKVFYLNYVTANLEENLSTPDKEIESGTFAALVVGLTAFDHPSTWDSIHRSWLGRQYFRTEIMRK